MVERFEGPTGHWSCPDPRTPSRRLQPGDVRPVGGGISELRINYGPGYRVYYAQRGRTLVLLLCGGDKATQDRDIKLARKIAEDWNGHEQER